MTNFERWQEYTAGLSSPQSFVDWTWYYTISAALQRRVWVGPSHQSCFPNMYVILVGAPGIGKGLVIREVSEMLKHWKRKHAALPENLTGNAKAAAEVVLETDTKNAQEAEFQGKQKGGDIMEALLIPVAADATTYEALVQAVVDSYRRINYTEPGSDGKDLIRTYGHSSLCFSLQELASLMRKRTDDTVNYMLGLYDCPTDYEYITKTKGKDRVRRGCLNLLAGTTPSFMQSTFDEKLMDEGFSSRTFYVYAQKNRKNQFWIPALSDNQHEHKKVLLDHIKKLTTLYGNVKIDEETRLFLEGWWKEQETEKHKRTNKSLKMTPYYSRKNIHVMKLAMAMHFGESLEMSIPLSTFKRAIEFLGNEEKNMHLALTLEGNNEEAKVAKKILELLSTGKKNFVDLHVETYSMIDKEGLEKSLSFLQDTNQIRSQIEDSAGQQVVYWTLKS